MSPICLQAFDVGDLHLNSYKDCQSILGPSFKDRQGQPNLKVLIPILLIFVVVWGVKPIFGEIMGFEFHDMADLFNPRLGVMSVMAVLVKRYFSVDQHRID